MVLSQDHVEYIASDGSKKRISVEEMKKKLEAQGQMPRVDDQGRLSRVDEGKASVSEVSGDGGDGESSGGAGVRDEEKSDSGTMTLSIVVGKKSPKRLQRRSTTRGPQRLTTEP